MNSAHLVRMANQIGAFFEAMPDREQAVRDVADHLRRSWDPRMREQLLGMPADALAEQLKPIVHEALAVLGRPGPAS
jgi:formate dehydrogenase subunit delta